MKQSNEIRIQQTRVNKNGGTCEKGPNQYGWAGSTKNTLNVATIIVEFPHGGAPPTNVHDFAFQMKHLHIKAVETTSEFQAELQSGRDGTEKGLLKSGTRL